MRKRSISSDEFIMTRLKMGLVSISFLVIAVKCYIKLRNVSFHYIYSYLLLYVRSIYTALSITRYVLARQTPLLGNY